MLIEDMLHKRDFATNISVAMRNQIGVKESGVYNIEDFETRNKDEFKDFVLNEFNSHGYNTLIFTGWAFTKELYYNIKNFIHLTEEDEDNYAYVLFIPELIMFIVCDSEKSMKHVLKSINKQMLEISSVNILNIEESDNGIKINYSNKAVLKFFEEKPKSIEKIIGEE